jgi:hypothetical protein
MDEDKLEQYVKTIIAKLSEPGEGDQAGSEVKNSKSHSDVLGAADGAEAVRLARQLKRDILLRQ